MTKQTQATFAFARARETYYQAFDNALDATADYNALDALDAAREAYNNALDARAATNTPRRRPRRNGE